MAEWYYKIAEQVVGPLSSEQLKALAEGGRLAPGDPVAKSSEGPWVTASRVKGLFEVAAIDDEPAEESPSSMPSPPVVSGEQKTIKEPPIPQPPVVMPAQGATPAASRPSAPAGSAPPAVDSAPAGGFAIHTEEVAPTERFQKKKRVKTPRVKAPKEPLTKKEKNARLVKWLAIAIVGGVVVLISIPFVRDMTRAAPEAAVAKNPIAADVDLAGAGDLTESSFDTSPQAARSRPVSATSKRVASPTPDDVTDSVEQVFAARGTTNDVEAKPVRVVLDRPLMTKPDGSGAARPSNRLLLVEMELTTKGDDSTTRFRGWVNYADEISLTDERGVEYDVRTPKLFGGRFVDGQCQEMVFLSSKEPTTDVVVFSWPDEAPELPSTSEETLKLRLPKIAYGEEGELRIAIPLSEIDVTEHALEKPPGGPPAAKPGTSDNVEEDDGGPIRIPGLMN